MIDRVERATRHIKANARASFERLEAREQRREQERREQALLARQKEVAAEREAAQAEFRRRELEQKKEQAWARYYVPPADCEKPPSWEFQVECGNRYMRARRDFEAKWSQGDASVRPSSVDNLSPGRNL
jgi:hypothetical protein